MPDLPVMRSGPSFKPPNDPCEACLCDPTLNGGGIDIVADAGTPNAKRVLHLCVKCYARGAIWAAKETLSLPTTS